MEATFCVLLPDPHRHGMPSPAGTGFFVSPDGWFVTAAHVIQDDNGDVRADIDKIVLHGVTVGDILPSIRMVNDPQLYFVDSGVDLALLKYDFDANACKDWLKDRTGFSWVEVSVRSLEEAEPVYSFGYPLSEGAIEATGPGMVLASTTLSPRVTSAIVASRFESHGMIQSTSDPRVYVLDKALNYGNSGGPIIAVETGAVHAVCTRFQPVYVPQPHIRGADGRPIMIQVPSLYGIVSSLSDRRIAEVFQERGIPVTD
jgi:serine protease Do